MKKTHAILLVDDEVKITQILSAYLRKEGYRTFTAFTGQQALELISQNEISLVVLDLMLPDISGGGSLSKNPPAVPRSGHYADGKGR